MAEELHVEVIRRGAELAISGRLDARSAAMAREVLHAAVDTGHGDIVVHVPDLEIWDASGLGVIVGVHRRARQAGRRLVLIEVPPRQLRLFRATRLTRVLAVEPVAVA